MKPGYMTAATFMTVSILARGALRFDGGIPLMGIADIELHDLQPLRRGGVGAKPLHGFQLQVTGENGVAALKQNARKFKADTAGRAGDDVVLHGGSY